MNHVSISYSNTSGRLVEREMLWEHEPTGSVFTAFSSSTKLQKRVSNEGFLLKNDRLIVARGSLML